MKVSRIDPAQIKFQFASDQGMSLELFIESLDGGLSSDVAYPLFRIVADDANESQYFEFISNGKAFQVPVTSLRRMLDLAASDVHSETWYEMNVFNRKEEK